MQQKEGGSISNYNMMQSGEKVQEAPIVGPGGGDLGGSIHAWLDLPWRLLPSPVLRRPSHSAQLVNCLPAPYS